MSQTQLTPAEENWYEHIYQGDRVPQLTLRAVLMGSFLGGFMALSNLYVGLKTGWSLGVAITACILSFAIYRALRAAFPRIFPTEMGILENNCMQSTASSAGYSTGGTFASAIAAYVMVTGHHIPWPILLWWTFFLASLGVFMAIPMKRQMINIEQLKFPSGIAAAVTLQSLHGKGIEASQKAKALGAAGFLGAALTWIRESGKPFAIPASIAFPGKIFGVGLGNWTVAFDMSTIMVAAGAIIGWKVGWSMLLGAIVNYLVLAPWMTQIGAIDINNVKFRTIASWSTWPGSALLVTSSLLTFAFSWRTIARSFSNLGDLFRPRSSKEDATAKIEVPGSWFLLGVLLSGMGCIVILYLAFGTTIWMGILSVVLTFFLALVACRATGESDITPMSAMGKITQLTFGIIAPSNIVTNLMTATVTAGAASSSADLLTDLKSGYILGANPRKQFIAQFLGIFAGLIFVIPAFYQLVPDASVLGSEKWPAPTAQVWAAVAKLLANGLHSLHPAAQMGLWIGGGVGIIFVLLGKLFPKLEPYIPSPTGFGLAFVIPFFNSFSMFLGALIAMVIEKRSARLATFIIPVSSGLIAGESLMGIAVALLQAAKWL